MNFPNYEGHTAVIIGTGPSLTDDQIQHIREYRQTPNSKIRVFGVNNAYQKDIVLDVLYACNPEWWDHYHEDVKMEFLLDDGYTSCWTWDNATARKYGLNWIEGRWSGGKRRVTSFSKDPNYIHYGHGSGYEVINLAYHFGCRHMVLVGYDLRYSSNYDPVRKLAGTEPRHFFGEYPSVLQHWPGRGGSVAADGQITGLLDIYRTVDCDDLGLRITNCSPGSALDFFETGELEKVLYEIHRPFIPVDQQNAVGLD
jgi:hypothetical protein